MLALEEDDDTPPNSPNDEDYDSKRADGKEGRNGRCGEGRGDGHGRESPCKRSGSPSRRSRPSGIHR